MLPIRHIEPFLHPYRDHYCCIHPYSFCEAISLYAINLCDQWVQHRSPRLFQLLFSGRIVSPRLWRVLLQLKSCALLSRKPRRSSMRRGFPPGPQALAQQLAADSRQRHFVFPFALSVVVFPHGTWRMAHHGDEIMSGASPICGPMLALCPVPCTSLMPLNLEPYATQCAPPCAGGFRPGPAQQALAQQTAQQPSWQNLAAGSAALFSFSPLPKPLPLPSLLRHIPAWHRMALPA
jgi:hypothetical protein